MRNGIKTAPHQEAFSEVPIDGAQQAGGEPGRDTFLTNCTPDGVDKFQLN